MGFFLGLSIFVLLSFFFMAIAVIAIIGLVIIFSIKGIRKLIQRTTGSEVLPEENMGERIMSERKIYCPNCGQERINNTGVFCTNCGTQLVDVGGRPGALNGRPVVNARDRRKNNVYANMGSVGYSTWWQTYGLERKIVTAAMWSMALCAFAGVGCIFIGHIALGFIMFAVGFIGMFATAGLSAMRKKNREQIRKNAVVYKGRVRYVRNPVTGEMEDSSQMDIHYLAEESGTGEE